MSCGAVRNVAAIFVAGSLLACANSGQSDDAAASAVARVERTDSGSVAIHTVASLPTAVALDSGAFRAWLPTDSIGLEELGQIAYAGLGADMRPVLALRRPARLFVFDSAHTPVALGAVGDGPGEFRSPTFAEGGSSGDVVIYDVANRRATLFPGEGRTAASATFATLSAFPNAMPLGVVGLLTNGALIVRAGVPAPPKTGFSRNAFRFVALWLDGRSEGLTADYAGDEMFMGEPGPMGFAAMAIPPFGQKTLAAACGRQVVVAENDRVELRALDLQGRLTRILRARYESRAIVDDDLRAFLQQSGVPEPSADDVARLREMTPRMKLPALRALHCSADGALAVELEGSPTASERVVLHIDAQWDVVRAYRVPASMRVFAFENDRLLVGWQVGETSVRIGLLELDPQGGGTAQHN
jgi:hypothetical protein